MNAFQTTLFPTLPPNEIGRLNQLNAQQLGELNLNIDQEIQRAIEVSESLGTAGQHRVFFVGDLLEVMCNLLHWNRSVRTEVGRKLWGRRRCRYFMTGAAFTAPGMTMELYASLDENEAKFDGNRAWRHMQNQLGMTLHAAADRPELALLFDDWQHEVFDLIQLDGNGAQILVPPDWFK